MSRAYAKFVEDDELMFRIAEEVGLLISCEQEVHQHVYYNPGEFSFIDVVDEIRQKLETYDIADDKKEKIVEKIEGLREIHADNCVECNRV